MELEKIIELMNAFDQSSLSSLKLEQEGSTITMEARKQMHGVIVPKEVSQEVVSIQETPVVEHKEQEGNRVKAPLVGTFYNSPSPEQPPFVKVGDVVKKGQTLGIVEAMKLMNEIESDFDGVVKEVLVKNEDMIEYGQPLFIIGS